MPSFVVFLLIFTGVGVAFILVNLSVGKLLRPANMNAEKGTIYECGEPAIGSAWVQFDLRFYVVALLFVIFDVEMAFFFPWAVVFGKANQLSDPNLPVETRIADTEALTAFRADDEKAKLFRERISDPSTPTSQLIVKQESEAASQLAMVAFFDILFFFGVLLVGFAYLWQRGDLNWVRSLAAQKDG
jgi:NADH-quinone oxidoreductase subunit A